MIAYTIGIFTLTTFFFYFLIVLLPMSIIFFLRLNFLKRVDISISEMLIISLIISPVCEVSQFGEIAFIPFGLACFLTNNLIINSNEVLFGVICPFAVATFILTLLRLIINKYYFVQSNNSPDNKIR